MTPGSAFLATLTEMMQLASMLPEGATVEVSWPDAPADLILVLAQQDGAELQTEGGLDEVEWAHGALTIRAQRPAEPTPPRPALRLVRP
jgi:hypothetical protein